VTRRLWPLLLLACRRDEPSGCPERAQRIEAELVALEQARAQAQPFELDASGAWAALVAEQPVVAIASRQRSEARLRVIVVDRGGQGIDGEIVDCDGSSCFAALAAAVAERREIEAEPAVAVVVAAGDAPTARVGRTVATLASGTSDGRIDLVLGREAATAEPRRPPPSFAAALARLRDGDPDALAQIREDVYVDCPLSLMPADLAPPELRDRVRRQLTVAGIQACGCEVDDDAVVWAEGLDVLAVRVVVVPLVVRDDGIPWPQADRWADGAVELTAAVAGRLATRPDEPVAVAWPP